MRDTLTGVQYGDAPCAETANGSNKTRRLTMACVARYQAWSSALLADTVRNV